MVVSFLIGSGFSIPVGIPGVSVINERLRDIAPQQFFYGTGGEVFWAEPNYPNLNLYNPIKKLFFSELMNWYRNSNYCGENFNYEFFYDFLVGNKTQEQLVAFSAFSLKTTTVVRCVTQKALVDY